jgi:hypothetical protein
MPSPRAYCPKVTLEIPIPDVVAHEVFSVSRLAGGTPVKMFGFDDPDVRIDDPNRFPDSRGAVFDVFCPHGGNIRVMEETG